jgi:TolB-like protein/DNA-binding winged helix-turn-helix (wHTH) protein/tetratricopeptide (TPR) repeat protein
MGDVYRFGPFVLNPEEHALTRDGLPIPITRKASDILLYLVQHPNRVVAKQDLIKAVWPDTFVEDGNLTQHISLLRKALAEHGDELIVTVARQGYRFTAKVAIAGDSTAPVAAAMESAQRRGWGTRRRTLAVVGALVVLSLGAWVLWQRSRVAPEKAIRLAVLPFDNLTGDPGEDYLADGLTEELITQLARLRPEQLDVIARASVMGYKHSGKRIDEIGRELSVSYALESSLRRSADSVRVTVQLIRVQGQSHLWAEEFDYASRDMLHIEDTVAQAVTREVKLRLTPVERARLTTRPSSASAAAVDAFLRGRDIMHTRGGKEGWEAGKRYFEQAIALDSEYSLAWAWLSLVHRVGADRGFTPADAGVREAWRTVKRALDLDPTLPEAYGQLGQIQRLVDWDWDAADASFQHALALDPGNVDAVLRAGAMAGTLGRLPEAITLIRRAVELDPLDPYAIALLGQTYYYAGRMDEAANCIEKVAPELRPPLMDQILAQVYLAQGRTADAFAVVEHESADPAWQLMGRSLVYFSQKRRRAADSVLAQYIAQYGTRAAYQIADIYAFRGDPDSVFVWLERAYAQRDEGLAAVRIDPLFQPVRRDPRYAALLTKMRLPQ